MATARCASESKFEGLLWRRDLRLVVFFSGMVERGRKVLRWRGNV